MAASFLEVLQLRSAIPVQWKRKLLSSAAQNLKPTPKILVGTGNGTPFAIVKKSSKFIYYSLIHTQKSTITSQSKWNDISPLVPLEADEYWSEVYRRPYQVACDTKLQAFQFRTIHWFIPCNSLLKNIRIRREDTCSFCPAQDTVQHFLFTCPAVDVFWRRVVAWFAEEAVHLHVSLGTFLFGLPEATPPQDKIVHFILLFSKFFIYRQKLFHQAALDLTQFLRELRTRLSVAKYITSKDNKQHLFARWQHIFAALG